MTDLRDMFAQDAATLTKLPSTEELDSAKTLASEFYAANSRVETLEKELEEAKEARKELQMRRLPALLDGLGTDRIGLPDQDVDVVVENYYHANIPKEGEEAAFAWLEENGHGDLIKVSLTALFGRGELELAYRVVKAINELLKKNGMEPRPMEVKRGVPWNTLTAFVKEQLEKGEVIPLDTLGAQVGRIVKIKNRTAKKGKR